MAQSSGGSINAEGGVAIHGFDPVAYFTEGKPTGGDPRFTTQWQGAEWRFASAENRELFLADPERYAPQYGGYCAWAVSRGNLADIDPDQWLIQDDRLYLNFSGFTNLRFKTRLKANIQAADQNWPEIQPE
jgi:hypothetical protein